MTSEKFLKIALNELGYYEKASNDKLDSKTANRGTANFTKYGKWYGINPGAWCGMFVSWCANEAGVLKTLIPRYAGCGTGYNWFKNKGKITMKPKAGDIGFLKPTTPKATASHTFIVYEVNGNTITTIEGNLDNVVKKRTRNLNDKNILGFGSVDWEEKHVIKYVYNVDDEGLVVHKTPGGSDTKELLKAGAQVKVYENQGYWSRIGDSKWVWSLNLSNKQPKTKKVYNVKKPPLNVRNTYNEKGKIVGALNNGDVVQVYKTKGKWSKVSKEEERWVFTDYLK